MVSVGGSIELITDSPPELWGYGDRDDLHDSPQGIENGWYGYSKK